MLIIQPHDVTAPWLCSPGDGAALAAASGRGEFNGSKLSPWGLSQNVHQHHKVGVVLMTLEYMKITLLQEARYSLGKACRTPFLLRHLAGKSFNQAKHPP